MQTKPLLGLTIFVSGDIYKLQTSDLQYSYFPNPSKAWLIVKTDHEEAAEEQFQNTGIKISNQMQGHLGAALGSRCFVEE